MAGLLNEKIVNPNQIISPKHLSVVTTTKKFGNDSSSLKQKPLPTKISGFNFYLSLTSVILLIFLSGVYFHSVQTEMESNKIQQEIIMMKESNYKLNVSLAVSKNLAKVENVALNSLKMKSADTTEINFLMLPQDMIKEDEEKIYAESIKVSPEILTGY